MPKPSLLPVCVAAALTMAACSHHPAKLNTSARRPSSGTPPIAGIASPADLGYQVDRSKFPGSGYESDDSPGTPEAGYDVDTSGTPGIGDEPDRAGISPSDGGAFPRFRALEPAVAFWRKTYALWHRSQTAIHDDRHLAVVYEVVDLPGEIGDSLSPEQKDWVAERRNYWKTRLSILENKLSMGEELDADDQRLVAALERGGSLQTVLPGASERVRSQRGMRERFRRGLEIGARYERTFRKIFREAGLPEDLAYLPHVESSFQASARSSAGAVGVWQFTRGAAEKFMNVNGEADERLDPVASTYGAARYLRYAYAKLGDWPTALTSYNHGINGMVRAQNRVGNDFMRIVERYDSPAFGFASRNYYAEFLAARDIARNPGQFFAGLTGESRQAGLPFILGATAAAGGLDLPPAM